MGSNRQSPLLAGAGVVLALLSLAAVPPSCGEGRRLIAVLDFDYSTLVRDTWEEPYDLGAGLADMLVAELVEDGTYTVVERKRLVAVMEEQNLNRSAQFDSRTATEIGKMLGVDAIVIGAVTRFGVERSTAAPSRTAAELYGGVSGVRRHIQKAVVGIDVRMIDTKTAAILVTASGYGEDERGAVVSGAGAVYHGIEVGDPRSFSSRTQHLVGAAAERAVLDLISKLSQEASRVAARDIRGLIAAVEGDTLVVNLGRADGLRAGSQLAVERIVKVVKDPNNPSKVLKRLGKRIAIAVVEDFDEMSAIARIQSTEPGEIITIGSEVTLMASRAATPAASSDSTAPDGDSTPSNVESTSAP